MASPPPEPRGNWTFPSEMSFETTTPPETPRRHPSAAPYASQDTESRHTSQSTRRFTDRRAENPFNVPTLERRYLTGSASSGGSSMASFDDLPIDPTVSLLSIRV